MQTREQPLPAIQPQLAQSNPFWTRLLSPLPMLHLSQAERDILVASTLFKVLLFPAYRSTDFEVHRNWMAITNSLPLSQWYFEATSQWTLDYPPFFAYFEFLLSFPARFLDKTMVGLQVLNYDAWSVVAYQRVTVIFSELLLATALLRLSRLTKDPSIKDTICFATFLHPGFLIVDHIHFQYNAFMFGILMWSLYAASKAKYLMCGASFAILLNFKHIYIYLAPAYFIFLLRAYCFSPDGSFKLSKFLLVGNVVIMIFALSLTPFALQGQLPQLFARLFPFTRGLNHAYWAPNVWALVTATDRALLYAGNKFSLNWSIRFEGLASSSRGLIGDTVFAVLPSIKPIHTFIITAACQSLYMIKLWVNPTYKTFLTALTLCGYTSFLFGWHVHEKAVLLILVPLGLMAAESYSHYQVFLLASIAGITGLFPLLFTPSESILKILYSFLWAVMVHRPLSLRLYEYPTSIIGSIIDFMEQLYLYGFAVLLFLSTIIPSVAKLRDRKCSGVCDPWTAYEFLPLMLTSVYCAVGLSWAFLRLSLLYMRQ